VVLILVISYTDTGNHAVHTFSGSRHYTDGNHNACIFQSSDSPDWADTLMVHPPDKILYLKIAVLFSNLIIQNLYCDDLP